VQGGGEVSMKSPAGSRKHVGTACWKQAAGCLHSGKLQQSASDSDSDLGQELHLDTAVHN
jgi:hypothetical protein